MKSLKSVNKKLHELATNGGDLTQKLEIKSGDELELISGNINSMLEYIRSIIISISVNSSALRSSTKSITNDISDTQLNITDVSATMQQMSASMEETSAALIEINDSINKISEEIEGINESTENGRDSSDKIMEKAAQIYENAIIEQSAAKQLANEMSASVNNIIEKSKAVETIQTLTDNIINITSQSNLLSLNASIEAARAGEAGRGFAVVADEIGKLAANSANVASQIQTVSKDVIDAVNALAKESKRMIQFMKETALTGYEKLLETSQNYQADVGNMNQIMMEFAISSETLKRNVEAIRESVNAVNIAIEENSKGIINVSESTANITTKVDDIGIEANTNLNVATSLDTEINRFKF